jgi:hypothetical protein
MQDDERGSVSLGYGMGIIERYLDAAKGADSTDEKIRNLTDALEALFLHVQHLNNQAELADFNNGVSGTHDF